LSRTWRGQVEFRHDSVFQYSEADVAGR
jgi:hypothetical protein